MRYFLILFISIIVFSACGSANSEEATPSNAKEYDLRGTVISVDKKNKKALIRHDEIPGFMSEMTMDFNIRDAEILEELSAGDEIIGILYVDNVNADSWLEIKSVSAAPRGGQKPLPVKENVGTIGKKVLDFSLVNQDGREISPKDFLGKSWAMTFIYAECPLPNYCILMSKNFSDAARLIFENENLRENTRLLSISFDPERDTPEKLKKYKLGYLGENSPAKDSDIWQVAVGPDERVRKIADFFGLDYKISPSDRTQFDHSLRTIVFDKDGKVTRILSGNTWTTQDLLAELKKNLD